MKNYINSFDTDADVQSAVDNKELSKPYVAYIKDTDTIDWNGKDIDYSSMYLTFEIISAGTIVWEAASTNIKKTISYSINNGEWTEITSDTGTAAPSISVNAGDEVRLKGNNLSYADYQIWNTLKGSAMFNINGNVMSLIYGDNYKNNREFDYAGDRPLSKIFSGSRVIDASNLILPADNLGRVGEEYLGMFSGCTSLISAPELPATKAGQACYESMFEGCTSLTTAPELHIETILGGRYRVCANMFNGCTSLVNAPELPATTVTNNYYSNMFQGCTSLTTAPELPATTLANNCYSNMFQGCTSLTTAPELPATTLVNECYRHMFANCTSLNYIKCLATDISANSCTLGWANSVPSTGTFVKNPNMNSWTTGVSGIPSGWTVVDAE